MINQLHTSYILKYLKLDRNMMKKLILVIMTSISITGHAAYGMIDLRKYSEKVYKPVAVVEDIMVSEDDVTEQQNIMRMSGIETSRDEATDSVINDIVIILNAKDMSVPEDFLNQTISNLAAENGLSVSDFKMKLKNSGIGFEYFKRYIEAKLILHDMIILEVKNINKSTLLKDLFKDSKSTKEYIRANDEAMHRPVIEYKFSSSSQVDIAEIIVSNRNDKHFFKIIELLKNKTLFKKIKEEFPEDVEINGLDGHVGWVKFSEMSKEYQTAINNVPVGNVAEPLVLGDKFLFIKVLDMKDVSIKKTFNNQKYIKMSYDEKADIILNSIQGKLYAADMINKMKKQMFIKKF